MSPKRITSAIYAVFTVLAASFVISSTYQIGVGVFTPDPADARETAKLAPACVSGVRTLAVAVDRGVAAAAGATSAAEAERRYRDARSPEWDEAKQRELVEPCFAAPSDARGADAVAAVSRLDRAAEGAIRHQTDELGPVRRAVDSFIR